MLLWADRQTSGRALCLVIIIFLFILAQLEHHKFGDQTLQLHILIMSQKYLVIEDDGAQKIRYQISALFDCLSLIHLALPVLINLPHIK